MIAATPPSIDLALGVCIGIALCAILAVVLMDCRRWPITNDPRGGGHEDDTR